MLLDTIATAAGRSPNDNLRSIEAGIIAGRHLVDLTLPHRLACYLAQLLHESARGRYDREVWGPTPAQVRYDTRTDLGNTAAHDGDGYRYRGRGPIQITGKTNYRLFTDWARTHIDQGAPDFVADPDRVNTDPWEGLGPVWYWHGNNLNRYCDTGDMENLTRRINGGLNGYRDRLDLYARSALVLLGYDPDDVKAFQATHALTADGIAGPITRTAMHQALKDMRPVSVADAPVATLRTETLTDLRAEIVALLSRVDAALKEV